MMHEEVLLRAEALPFEQLHMGDNLPYIGTRKQGHSDFPVVEVVGAEVTGGTGTP